MASDSTTRAAGTCTECGKMFAVRRSQDGTVAPIGVPDCSCGGTSFRVFERATPAERSSI